MDMNDLNAIPLPVCRDVTLKNLSRYGFSWDGERLAVRVRRTGRIINGYKARYGQTYYLIRDDTTKRYAVSRKQILFLLRHPEIDYRIIDFRSLGLTTDGTVTFPNEQTEKRRSYSTFRSIDDAIETCIIIKEYQQGNEGPLRLWIHEARKNAVDTVHQRMKCGYTATAESWDDAVETFIGELRNMNVRRIQPLFSWLCKCLQYTAIRRGSRRRILNELKLHDPEI